MNCVDSNISIICDLITPDIAASHNAILDYFLCKKKDLCNKINALNDVKDLISRSEFNNCRASFAWIPRVGHYIIEYIEIEIGRQVIDTHYGEWLDIWNMLTLRDSKQVGYNKLIGDIPELTEYSATVKPEYELLIPLQFWFCRNIGNCLPIIALNEMDIRLNVKFRDFNKLAIYEPFTDFRIKPRMQAKLIAEYLYVDQIERLQFAKNKLEYIIDVLYYQNTIINKNDITDTIYDTRIYFQNICKELIWFIDRCDNDFIVPNRNIIRSSIRCNSQLREAFKSNIYYNYVKPYECNNRSPEDGIMAYNFALFPENIQPSGGINLSGYENITITNDIDECTVRDIFKGIIYRMATYSLSCNILRIYAGVSALVFYS